jgi:hypothetical protein
MLPKTSDRTEIIKNVIPNNRNPIPRPEPTLEYAEELTINTLTDSHQQKLFGLSTY